MTDHQHEDEADRWGLEQRPEGRAGAPLRRPPDAGALYAELPVRVAAFLIDVLLATFLFQLWSQIINLGLLWVGRSPDADSELARTVASLLLALGSLAITATAVYFWRVFRATPGQMLFGLFVVRRTTGERLPLRASAARWLLLYAPLTLVMTYSTILDSVLQPFSEASDPLVLAAVALLVPIGWYLLLAASVADDDRRGRGLHDRVAGSVVVRRAGPPA